MTLNRTLEVHSRASVLYCTSAFTEALVLKPYFTRAVIRFVE